MLKNSLKYGLIFAVLVIIFCAFSLYQVKYRVQNLKRDLAETHRQLKQTRETIHILKAEWAYLTQPNRIVSLAKKHLQMDYAAASNISQYSLFIEATPSNAAAKFATTIQPKFKPTLTAMRVE